MKMSKTTLIVMAVLTLAALVLCPLLYLFVGPRLDVLQTATLKILLYICAGSALFCFIVGQTTGNNSQMDKLWSLLPIAYTLVAAVKGGMKPRLVIMFVLALIWGARLTMNFARKGAYKLKFWEGREDYRWAELRKSAFFSGHKVRWFFFNLGFISIYQNLIVLLITLPALAAVSSTVPLGVTDWVAAGLTAFFILFETVADEQQWRFQTEKWAMLRTGTKLENLPSPYCLGFNTTGLWNRSRHPNYLGEQAIWVSFYLFSVGAGVGVCNYSVAGALLLVVLFFGSSAMSESISLSKYPLYADYLKKTSKFIPWKKYRGE